MELGGKIEKNEKGEIISAGSLLMMWYVKVDLTKKIIDDSQGFVGDVVGLEWEQAWIKTMKEFVKRIPHNSGITLYFANASW